MSGILFDKYFKYVEKTEPPLVFHRWSLLTSLGAMLGRQYYLPFGDFNIFPTMYCMLIGTPGTRKSTAIKLSKKVLSGAGYETFAAERTSKEKFLIDLEGVEDDDGKVAKSSVMQELFGEGATGEPRQVYIVADEFNEFVGSSNLEFLSLLGTLWDWDDSNNAFKQRLKTSRSVTIYQPTISILSGNTHSGFAEAFPPQALGQGFLSRVLLIHGESSGIKIAFPEPPSAKVRQDLIDLLLDIKHTVHGQATWSPKAMEMMEVIYRTHPGMEDSRFAHYATRRHTHLIKLCMLTAAANKRTLIGANDVLFANTLLTFTEHRMPAAMGEYGKSKHSDVAAKIITYVGAASAPRPVADIWKQVVGDLDRIEDMQRLLANLTTAGKLQFIQGSGNDLLGGYLPVRKMLKTKAIYVDYSLLPESTKK